jgi:bifunctional UDP-N-acetylglucosamine pyrophosphorylase / glucosamine-1-phosphate N-acetyltransferase
MKNTTAVILAAGMGTRMRSARAKVLHQAGGETILNQVIRAALHVAEPQSIVVVVGHQSAEVRASVKTQGIRFAEQNPQRGTGHALCCARASMPSHTGELVIFNGDGPLLRPSTLQQLVGLYRARLQGERRPAGAIVTTQLPDPTGYGRILRDDDGDVAEIVEQKSTTPEQAAIREVNPGLYCFDATLFWKHVEEIQPNNAANEYYLTDMVEILRRHGHAVAPLLVEDHTELLGINTRVELAIADGILRMRKATELMLSGVTIESPETVTIDVDVEIGPDSVIEANTQLRGATRIGAGCRIGSGSILRDCELADGATILPYVVAEASQIGAGASVGPFTRLRMNAYVGESAHVGNFVELKKARLGAGSKAGHLAYLGDAIIAEGVNIGAGTITCNYDGKRKHQTLIGKNVFVGSNSTLVAPVELGDGSYIGAGSVITKKVEPDALAIGRAHQIEKQGWARRRRQEPAK